LKHSYGLSMILTCEQCQSRYLVPQHAIGPEGRTVRCTHCQHEWFQDSEEPSSASEILDELDEVEPIPEAVMPVPDDSELPVIREEDMPDDSKSWHLLPRMAGYAAAAAIFLLIGGGLLGLHGPIVKLWSPTAGIYEMAGIATTIPGEGLIFDRVSAVVGAGESGAHVLNIKGVIVNLKDGSIDIPPVHTSLRLADGSIFDSWQFDPPVSSAKPGEDVPFQALYPNVPGDVKEVSVSFRLHKEKAEDAAHKEEHEEQHEEKHEEKNESGH